MRKAGLVKNLKKPIKVLGRGEIEMPLVVQAHAFSDSARRKIEAVGGRVKELEG
jgi:large subunit ribosomal protein L15